MTEEQVFASISPGQMPAGGPDRSRFDERPAAIKRWVETLPLGNLPETGRQVHAALADLEQIGLSAKARLQVLRELEQTLDYVYSGLGKLYANQPFPLASRARRAARLVVTVCEAMTRNYRMCLLADAGGLTGLGKHQRAEVMTGICHHAGRALLECWLLFEQPPRGVWLLLHETYRLAASEGIHRTTCAVDKRHASTDSCYKQLLLTDAVNPWHMPRGEVVDIYRTLGLCAHVATLDAVGPGRLEQDRPVFLVDPNRDSGSLPARAIDSVETADCMLLHTDRLAAALETPREPVSRWTPWRKGKPRPISESERRHINEIEIMLALPTKRRAERIEVEERAKAIIGLTAIHHLLQTEVDVRLAAATDEQQQARFEGHDIARREVEKVQPRARDEKADASDVWQMIYAGKAANTPELAQASITEHVVASIPDASSGARVSSRRVQAEDFWSLADVSATGFCLKAGPDTQSTAEAGDLILIKAASINQQDVWQTGIIRWLRNNPVSGIRIGVQRLSGTPRPVLTSLAKGDGGRSDAVRSLLLPADPVYNAPATLVTPARNYRPETPILLSDGRRDFSLKLERMLDDFGGVRQFTFVKRQPETGVDGGEADKPSA